MRKGTKYPVEPLTRSEVERLLQACSKGPTGIRNRALLAVMWRSGLRVSEALALRPCDVEANAIRILHGKGDQARVVGLDVVARALLDLWLAKRPNAKSLFCTLQGAPVKTAYVRALMKRLAADAGIMKRCHPHQLRHTMAVDLVNERVPLNVISAQLGHHSLATTERYVNHLNPAAVIDIISNRR